MLRRSMVVTNKLTAADGTELGTPGGPNTEQTKIFRIRPKGRNHG